MYGSECLLCSRGPGNFSVSYQQCPNDNGHALAGLISVSVGRREEHRKGNGVTGYGSQKWFSRTEFGILPKYSQPRKQQYIRVDNIFVSLEAMAELLYPLMPAARACFVVQTVL